MRQVLTELDLFTAMCDYMAEQLEGRFTVEFPNHRELTTHIAERLRDPAMRENVNHMAEAFESTVWQFTNSMNKCALSGCDNIENHKFLREFIDMVWDSRACTVEWLEGQGIVPGQSAN